MAKKCSQVLLLLSKSLWNKTPESVTQFVWVPARSKDDCLDIKLVWESTILSEFVMFEDSLRLLVGTKKRLQN